MKPGSARLPIEDLDRRRLAEAPEAVQLRLLRRLVDDPSVRADPLEAVVAEPSRVTDGSILEAHGSSVSRRSSHCGAVVMIAWLLLGCTPAPPPPAALVVVVDRLRADELGAYGNLPTDTPRIDALARRATRYVRAYAPATSVGPSRTSLMQGQLPPQHGHREDVDYPAKYGRWVSETGWAPCEIYLSVSDIVKGTFELDKCVSKESELVVVWVERSEAVPLSELDQMVGVLSPHGTRLDRKPGYFCWPRR